MESRGKDLERIRRRVRACDYLSTAQLFLQDNFLLDSPLTPEHIKPRLLGHWGTCHGINVAYANLRAYFSSTKGPQHPAASETPETEEINPFKISSKPSSPKDTYRPDYSVVDPNYSFLLGPGHSSP